jgi:HPt (histidine-containing phosphotransfer) domain-containing protein
MNPATEYDPEALVRLRRIGNAAFVREMIDLFEQLAGDKIAAARRALAAGDLTALADAAHPLKSSSGGIGARLMFDLAARIELLSLRGEREPLPGLVAELEAAFDRIRPELHTARANLPP